MDKSHRLSFTIFFFSSLSKGSVWSNNSEEWFWVKGLIYRVPIAEGKVPIMTFAIQRRKTLLNFPYIATHDT